MKPRSEYPPERIAVIEAIARHEPNAYEYEELRPYAASLRHPADRKEPNVSVWKCPHCGLLCGGTSEAVLQAEHGDCRKTTINADRTSLLRLYEGALAQREKLRSDLAAALTENVALKLRVSDLEREKREHRCELPRSIQEALNSGDGVYRP